MKMCPHCGELFPDAFILVPSHAAKDQPEPATCPGSRQNPRNPETDNRPLWNGEPNPHLLSVELAPVVMQGGCIASVDIVPIEGKASQKFVCGPDGWDGQPVPGCPCINCAGRPVDQPFIRGPATSE